MRASPAFTSFVLAAAGWTAVLAAQSLGQPAGPPPGAGNRPAQSNEPRPQRDRGQDRTAPQPAGTARISGHVVTADTGAPMRRTRVMLTAAELPGGRAAMTDDQGRFDFPALPAGRYTLTASRSGFVTMAYGQRRPRQPGTPLQLADGQQMGNVDLRLPRGGAISGHIVDDIGEPLVGASVSVMRYDYAQGTRQLVPAGSDTTDDQGAYRVWGLNPGSYYVTATARNFDLGRGIIAAMPPDAVAALEQAAQQVQQALPFGGRGGRGAGPAAAVFTAGTFAAAPAEPTAYTPTYYPGVSQPGDAQPVNVSLSAEVSNINFSVLMARAGRIVGHVATSDNRPVTFGSISLVNETGRGPGMNVGGRITGDGSFTIPMVPPGRYTLRARTGGQDAPQFAQQSITVGDGDTQNLSVTVAPGGTISGSVTFQSTSSSSVPDASQVRLVAPTADFAAPGPNAVARVQRDGSFSITGVMAGAHWLRAQSSIRGWTLKSVTIDGRDVTDTPIDVGAGQSLGNVRVVFTDRVNEINGTLTDERQTALTDYTVLAFPTDESLWRPQSRQIAMSRPDQNGRFQLRGLPAGSYYLIPIDPEEAGEWFEPSFLAPLTSRAARLTLGDGDTKTQDFRLVIQ